MPNMRFDTGMTGNEDDLAQFLRLDLLEKLEAVSVRQHEIEQQKIVIRAFEFPSRICQGLRSHDIVTMKLQCVLCGIDEVGLIVDQ